jgi:hypothetical protein
MIIPSTMPPLTLPFIIMEMRRLWVTLHLVVSIDMKRRILGVLLVVVIHILEVLLVNCVIHNIPPCIWIMIFSFYVLLSTSTHVGLVPS